MKRISFIIASFLAFTFILSSCKKCDPIPNYTGKWVGKYGTTLPGTQDYTLFLNADGELGVIDGLGATAQAKGTWTVIGTTFRGTYKYLPSGSMFSVQATVSADGKTMSNGTYGANDNVSGGGVFSMTKQ